MRTRRRFLYTCIWTPPILAWVTACSGARPGVTVTLDHGPTAPLGGTMTFTLTATSVWDAPSNTTNGPVIFDAEVGWLLTDGLGLLTPGWTAQVLRPGTTSYARKVVFQANQAQTVEISIQLISAGIHTIRGRASLFRHQGPTPSDSDGETLYLKVDAVATQIQRGPFPEQRIAPS